MRKGDMSLDGQRRLRCWSGCVAYVKIPTDDPSSRYNGRFVTVSQQTQDVKTTIFYKDWWVIEKPLGPDAIKMADDVLVPLEEPGDDEVDEVAVRMSEKANAKKILDHRMKEAEKLLDKLKALPRPERKLIEVSPSEMGGR